MPVLSNTTSVMPTAFSIDLGDLIIMPFFAALPDATRSAIGVANPRAHGHAITNTATAVAIDCAIGVPVKYQARKVEIESNKTIGTKTLLTRSANC
ncbi:unannotated protein [freshwater metagenome]|uniref:Unannotated protein n=1 Tax=freshwater metagenome TaxID=449393 RepID=A0A6J7UDX9_9ZZZZ